MRKYAPGSRISAIELRREESVGPKIGGELRTAAVNSIVAGLALIVLYITIRFVFRYGIAAILALVLVFLLMGILFESFILPFSILTTIPFTIVGAYWTLYLTGTAMDSIGWIGIIILIGVVVNNGIVLIDRVHRLRLEGVPREQAVLDGSAQRVRPIMMTALTTIGGLMPMAMGSAATDGIDYRALATCVSGGLGFSTVFTIWVVPLTYTLMDDLGQAFRLRSGWYVRLPILGARALTPGTRGGP